MSSWRSDLIWYFANEHVICPVTSDPIPEDGTYGSGNRGTKGIYRDFDPDLDALTRWGAVSRVLHRLPASDRAVLELAYGDAGAAVTECSLYTDRRWRALAARSTVAAKAALTFEPKPNTRDERARDTSCGSRAAHWANDLLAKKAPNETERASLQALRDECTKRLAAAENAYRDAEAEALRSRPARATRQAIGASR